MTAKEIVVVGGPNGSGKTTFAEEFRADRRYPYISADLIASELSAPASQPVPIAAGREFIHRIQQRLAGSESFLVESTLSGRGFRSTIQEAKRRLFEITIIFVYLDSAETCVARIQERVRKGGHAVAEQDVRRRFGRSLNNFWHVYRPIADRWLLLYNSEIGFKDVAIGTAETCSTRDEARFREFQKQIEAINDKS